MLPQDAKSRAGRILACKALKMRAVEIGRLTVEVQFFRSAPLI